MMAFHYGTIVGYQGRGTGRPIYEIKYERVVRRNIITISNNGYIVGANQQSTKESRNNSID